MWHKGRLLVCLLLFQCESDLVEMSIVGDGGPFKSRSCHICINTISDDEYGRNTSVPIITSYSLQQNSASEPSRA